MGIERLEAGDLSREVGVAGLVDVFQDNRAAALLPTLFEELGQGGGEVISLVDQHIGGFGAEFVHSIIGHGEGLGVIAKGDHKELVADLFGQGGQGGPGRQEGDAGLLGNGTGGQGIGGVVETADSHNIVNFDHFGDGVGDGRLVGFAIDSDNLNGATQDAAGGVDLLGGQLHPIQTRRINRRHPPGHVVHPANFDRFGRRGRRSRLFGGRRRLSCFGGWGLSCFGRRLGWFGRGLGRGADRNAGHHRQHGEHH